MVVFQVAEVMKEKRTEEEYEQHVEEVMKEKRTEGE
jgi:hypothetical protein